MKQILYLFVALFFGASAQAKDTIVFLNGITNDDPKARISAERLKEKLYSSALRDRLSSGAASVAYWNNPTSGFDDDTTELIQQARLSHDALSDAQSENPLNTQSSPRYQYFLGKRISDAIASGKTSSEKYVRVYSVIEAFSSALLKRLNSGDNIVVVSHSQGNFFAEQANAYIRYKYADDSTVISNIDSKLRFVGVASVAMTTPNGRYITIAEDKAINSHVNATALLSNFHVLPRNAFLCDGLIDVGCQAALLTIDLTTHGFNEIYM